MNLTIRHAATCLLALVATAPSWGGAPTAPTAARHEQERAHCMSGKSQQDQATCLKEVGAAHQESRRAGLGTQGDGQLSNNAIDRCRAQPEADRTACIDRIQGAGSSEGSVLGGGVIRQTETKLP